MDTYGRPEQFIGFQYFVLDVEDWSECGEELAGKWDQAFEFIEQAKAERGKVFVHCFAGISRSTAVCTAYLMARRGLSYADAKRHVRKFRRKANPNAGFVAQLRLLDERLQERTIESFLEGGGLGDGGKGTVEDLERGQTVQWAQEGGSEEVGAVSERVAEEPQKPGLVVGPSAGSNGNGTGPEGRKEGEVLEGEQERAALISGREEMTEAGFLIVEAQKEATVRREVTASMSPTKRQMSGGNGRSSLVALKPRFTGQAVRTGLAGRGGVPASESTESYDSLWQGNGDGLEDLASGECFADENEVPLGNKWNEMLHPAERKGCAKRLFGTEEEGRGESVEEERTSTFSLSADRGSRALLSWQSVTSGRLLEREEEERQNRETSYLGDGIDLDSARAMTTTMENDEGDLPSSTDGSFRAALGALRSDAEDHVVEKRIDGTGTRVHFGVGTRDQQRSGLEAYSADSARVLFPLLPKGESAETDTGRGGSAARFALLEGFAWELATMDWLAGVCFRALGLARSHWSVL
ncbi:Dual specificity protein phosphatase family protein [Klebsormidium nitens]|uniref:protein-tyrosine-phosphatase n=1 Tax=Klebsormidium nitens TaxID=105231 RepID=A0A1Y1I5P5_KLENI|nr:Dual specificity protein phosphatase family protein [Klebsormidium nitens]|eukprot:GAQ83438.1 Dual specificity protein phosphatase family protein [Klebsormidium nitens]